MKAKISFLACALNLFFAFSACDIVDQPIDPNGKPVTTGNKVMIEDFTGHKCGNCPNAHVKAKELKDVYGDDLIVVAVHPTGVWSVLDSAGGYEQDFTCEMADAMDRVYKAYNNGLPTGMVNRWKFNGTRLVSFTSWSTHVASVLLEEAKLDVILETTYDESTRRIDVKADLDYYTEGDADHFIVVIVTEDSVVSKQANYFIQPPHHDPYYQPHVLRGSITPINDDILGIPVKGNKIFVGEKIEHNFSAILDAEWDANQCSIVAYVMNKNSLEVLAVEEAHVME